MAHNQLVLNYLYMAEELLEKAYAKATDEDYRPFVIRARSYIADILEGIEDQQDPEFHPNYSVLPISEPTYYKEDQSHFLKRFYTHKGKTFRIVIRVNAYQDQSYAIIEGFDITTLNWNRVSSLPFEHWPPSAQSICYAVPLTLLQQGGLLLIAERLCEDVRVIMFTPDEEV